MEAATQLFRHPHVTVHGSTVHVDGLTIDDPCTVALLTAREQAREDPARTLVEAIEIGSRVLDREQAAAQTEYVRSEFEKASREVEQAFTDKARTVAEHFGRKVDEVFAPDAGVLSRALERHFSDGSSSAVQHRVRAVMDEVMTKSREDMIKQLSSSDGLLADFKRGVSDSVTRASERSDQNVRMLMARMQELQLELEKLRSERAKLEAVEAEAERGTAKGRSFETAVAEAVDAIAAAKGDDCDAVGDQPGVGGRKGDVVVGIDGASGPVRGRMVIEAKDRQLSKKAALAELEGAMETRDAQYALLVVPTQEHLPARTHQLREYGGDKLLCIYDPEDAAGPLALEVAYGLARARVLAARGESASLDASALSAEAERALVALEDVRRVKQQLTAATTAIEGSREILEAMAKAVRGHLAAIDELIREAQAEGA